MVAESYVVADDGTELYLRVAEGPGDASRPTAVLADGIACDGFIWKYLFDQLAGYSRVAHFNYRGHGRSRKPADPDRIRVSDHAADLSAVRRSLGGGPVVLFGHSMGCQVVLENHRQDPHDVKGLVLICGAPGRVTHSFKGTDVLAQVLPRLIDAVDKHPHVARAVWGSVPPELSLRVALALGEVDAKLMNPRDLVAYLEHMVDIDLPMFLRMLRAAGDHDATDHLPNVQVPGLVIAGQLDSFTPARFAEEMSQAMPRGQLLMTSGTHVVPLEHRQLVQESVLTFLNSLDDSAETRADNAANASVSVTASETDTPS